MKWTPFIGPRASDYQSERAPSSLWAFGTGDGPWCLAVECLMSAFVSVVLEVARPPIPAIGSCDVLHELDLFALNGASESFDHHVVNRAALR